MNGFALVKVLCFSVDYILRGQNVYVVTNNLYIKRADSAHDGIAL